MSTAIPNGRANIRKALSKEAVSTAELVAQNAHLSPNSPLNAGTDFTAEEDKILQTLVTSLRIFNLRSINLFPCGLAPVSQHPPSCHLRLNIQSVLRCTSAGTRKRSARSRPKNPTHRPSQLCRNSLSHPRPPSQPLLPPFPIQQNSRSGYTHHYHYRIRRRHPMEAA